MSEGGGHDFSRKISGTLNEGGSIAKQLGSTPDSHSDKTGLSLFKKLANQSGIVETSLESVTAARVAETPEFTEQTSAPNIQQSGSEVPVNPVISEPSTERKRLVDKLEDWKQRLDVSQRDDELRISSPDGKAHFTAINEGGELYISTKLVGKNDERLSQDMPRFGEMFGAAVDLFADSGKPVKRVIGDWGGDHNSNLNAFVASVGEQIGNPNLTADELYQIQKNIPDKVLSQAALSAPTGKLAERSGFGRPVVNVDRNGVQVIFERSNENNSNSSIQQKNENVVVQAPTNEILRSPLENQGNPLSKTEVITSQVSETMDKIRNGEKIPGLTLISDKGFKQTYRVPIQMDGQTEHVFVSTARDTSNGFQQYAADSLREHLIAQGRVDEASEVVIINGNTLITPEFKGTPVNKIIDQIKSADRGLISPITKEQKDNLRKSTTGVGLIQGDLDPSNIIVGPNGEVTIIDWTPGGNLENMDLAFDQLATPGGTVGPELLTTLSPNSHIIKGKKLSTSEIDDLFSDYKTTTPETSNPHNDAMRTQAEESANAAAEEKRKLEAEAAAKAASRQAEIDRITKLQSEFAAISAAKEAELAATRAAAEAKEAAEAKAKYYKDIGLNTPEAIARYEKDQATQAESERQARERFAESEKDRVQYLDVNGIPHELDPSDRHFFSEPVRLTPAQAAREMAGYEANPPPPVTLVELAPKPRVEATTFPEPKSKGYRSIEEYNQAVKDGLVPGAERSFGQALIEGGKAAFGLGVNIFKDRNDPANRRNATDQELQEYADRRSGVNPTTPTEISTSPVTTKKKNSIISGVGAVLDALRRGTDAAEGSKEYVEETKREQLQKNATEFSRNYGEILGLTPEEIEKEMVSSGGEDSLRKKLKERQKQISADAEQARKDKLAEDAKEMELRKKSSTTEVPPTVNPPTPDSKAEPPKPPETPKPAEPDKNEAQPPRSNTPSRDSQDLSPTNTSDNLDSSNNEDGESETPRPPTRNTSEPKAKPDTSPDSGSYDDVYDQGKPVEPVKTPDPLPQTPPVVTPPIPEFNLSEQLLNLAPINNPTLESLRDRLSTLNTVGESLDEEGVPSSDPRMQYVQKRQEEIKQQYYREYYRQQQEEREQQKVQQQDNRDREYQSEKYRRDISMDSKQASDYDLRSRGIQTVSSHDDN